MSFITFISSPGYAIMIGNNGSQKDIGCVTVGLDGILSRGTPGILGFYRASVRV